jgi:hypothetical protein
MEIKIKIERKYCIGETWNGDRKTLVNCPYLSVAATKCYKFNQRVTPRQKFLGEAVRCHACLAQDKKEE